MPFAVCAYALLVFCGWKATVGILVQWVPCALREGRVCARADAAENTAAGQDLAYCSGGGNDDDVVQGQVFCCSDQKWTKIYGECMLPK